MSMFGTYDHTKVNISFNGIALTDFNGDVTIEQDGNDFETIQGSNGSVERSRNVNNIYRVTLPMMQTSPQISALEALRIADNVTGAGPFPFAVIDTNGVYQGQPGAYVLMGQAWIESMGSATKGRQTAARNIVITVKAEIAFLGA